MIVAGIDPGKTGALVILYPDDTAAVLRVPLQRLAGKETAAWSEWGRSWTAALAFGVDMVVIERVGAMPKQGLSSTFNFGRSYGFVQALGYSAGAPLHDPTPTAWKSKMGLVGADKNASRELVRRLLPKLAGEVTRVKDDGVAEAALLALYGRKHL